mmetsp:Transcript_151176/g.264163  ORF Transcript_151176/g.264163 Transcript_151176/m.264163 type:complete len:86 (+) Transcript_151176:132-389(+)
MDKVPAELQFVLSSSRCSQVLVSAHGMCSGPRQAQIGQDTISKQEGSQHNQTTAQTLPEGILSINKKSRTHQGQHRSVADETTPS